MNYSDLNDRKIQRAPNNEHRDTEYPGNGENIFNIKYLELYCFASLLLIKSKLDGANILLPRQVSILLISVGIVGLSHAFT